MGLRLISSRPFSLQNGMLQTLRIQTRSKFETFDLSKQIIGQIAKNIVIWIHNRHLKYINISKVPERRFLPRQKTSQSYWPKFS